MRGKREKKIVDWGTIVDENYRLLGELDGMLDSLIEENGELSLLLYVIDRIYMIISDMS